MPEKRRKNNKNKRKNKNNRSEVSNSVSKDTKKITSNDTVSNQPTSNEQTSLTNIVDVVVTPAPENVSCETQNQSETNTSNSNLQVLIQNDNTNCENNTASLNDAALNLIREQILDIDSQAPTPYVVESPGQEVKTKPKIGSTIKSKSLDSDDVPKIVEITDVAMQSEEENNLSIINSCNVLVSDVESDVEWEKIDDIRDSKETMSENVATGTLSITSIPLDFAQCEQTKSLTPQEEISLRNYLKTLDLSTSPENINSVEIKTEIEQIINREIKHRLRKKGITDEFLLPRLGPSRILDVIAEEGSGESSQNSRRQSYLSDKKSDTESVDDDVFEDKNASKQKFCTKALGSLRDVTFGRLVPQKCVLVGAKLKEPEVSEARGDWTMTTIEKMTGAEVVYLTDSSSSTSSLHEIGDDNDDGIESDVSIRMTTPTIEVTDTENLLKNTFITKINKTETPSDTNESEKSSENKNNEHVVPIEYEKNYDAVDNKDSQSSHEIVVLSTDNIKTDLYVKDINESKNSSQRINAEEISINSNPLGVIDKPPVAKSKDEYDLEIKVIKCELNDAINNLIKEVTSDSENTNDNTKDTFTRQDSSSSICSSQCTAKYNPTYSSLNDVSNLQSDEVCENTPQDVNLNISQEHKQISSASHVKEVIERASGADKHNNIEIDDRSERPSSLKDICVKRVALLPFGEKILEELASVSEKLQRISAQASETNTQGNIFLSADSKTTEKPLLFIPGEESIPPLVTPRTSSLKVTQEENFRTIVSNKSDNNYVCMSPSQKMLMTKTNTALTNDQPNDTVYKRKLVDDNVNYKAHCSETQPMKVENVNASAGPFKSQTGSRLLALICDPVITANVNSLKKHYNNSVEELRKKIMDSENKPIVIKEKLNTVRDISNIFQPIPPPRARKISSSVYESDESSDFTDTSLRSMKREKKVFHFSTGNLNKEIENDISSIQNRHRFYTEVRDHSYDNSVPRRPSLPKDLCDQQMEYIRQKEKEVEAEIQRLQEKQNNFSNIPRRGPRAPLISEREIIDEKIKDANNYSILHKKNITIKSSGTEKPNEKNKMSSLFSSSQEELQREKMYSEYVSQMAEREERKQHKIIKITNTPSKVVSKSLSELDVFDSKMNNRIEEEFISKARQRWEKLGIRDPETEDESELNKSVYIEPKVIEHKIKVIECGKEKDVKKLPSHLQDFVRFTTKDKATSSSAVWRPNAPTPPPAPAPPAASGRSPGGPPPPPPPPVWAPGSAGASPLAERKTYRPVHFEETPPSRRKFGNSEQNGCTSGSESEGRLRTSQSAPATGLSNLSSSTSRLPRAQNPTVTLLQKAREGQIPRGASYLQFEKDSARLPRDRPSPPKSDPVHALRKEYAHEADAPPARDMAGVGPVTHDGMPVALRSEAKDPSRWYKKMYDTIHKNKYDNDYVTIRYKSRRGSPPERVLMNKSQYLYLEPRSGYASEPEGAWGGWGAGGGGGGGGDAGRDVTARRRTASVQDERRASDVTTPYMQHNKYSTLASARASQEVYKNQPGRIEDYVPGRSSVVDSEAKQWWDEVMDIFDGQNIPSTGPLSQASPKEKKDITSAILSKSNMAKALKESGYESDSTLVFRRRADGGAPLSPAERRAAYRDLQAGGEPPMRGFRSPAPHRQEAETAPEPPRRSQLGSYSDTESPRRYVESDVNIHYRCPVRHDPLPLVPERELARQQAEHMKKLYREQKRNKYLQELQDMQNRRHQDNFTPSQKTVVPLNRYDEADKVIAKAMYTFNGQTARELSFRKGDIIHVRRQIDSNWYEGEVHGKIGLFPYNYVELQKGDTLQTPKKPAGVEGRARAKFDFTAQTNLELPLKKGEVVVLTRRIDQNWWEGRHGVKTGIFPDSYVTVLQEPSPSKPELKPANSDKPAASPAAHGLLNGADKRSMGAHRYTPQPNSAALANAPPATAPLPGYTKSTARGYSAGAADLNNTEPLYVDTNAEAVPYRAMYKYRPQNPDELELCEGDTVYVLEKCDDGWYVGSSQRTGRFGTFPGNYVERI